MWRMKATLFTDRKLGSISEDIDLGIGLHVHVGNPHGTNQLSPQTPTKISLDVLSSH